MSRRRAIAIREPNGDTVDFDRLVEQHDLDIVHTIYIDPASPHAGSVAAQQALDHDVYVLVAAELDEEHGRQARSWAPARSLADIVTASGVIECTLVHGIP